MTAIRRHLTYANVVVTLLVFVVLGGTAWALAKNSVGSRQIKPGAVKRSDLATNAVNGAKVANGSLGPGEFASGALPRVRFHDSVPGQPTVTQRLVRFRGLELAIRCDHFVNFTVGEVLASGPPGSDVFVSGAERQGGEAFAKSLELTSEPQSVVSLGSENNSAHFQGLYRDGGTLVSFEVTFGLLTNCDAEGSALATP